MAIADVIRTGITEPDEEQHGIFRKRIPARAGIRAVD
jgi:hypothetical protein